MLYTSIENKKIKELKKLNIKKYRDQSNTFLIEGKHLVLEAYKKGLLEELLLEENTTLDIDIKTSYLSRQVIKYISELDNPSNIMGICKKMETKEIGNKVLILDDIQDPGNFGTIIRSAVAFHIDTIVVSNNTVDLYNSKVIRASQGMLFNINIIKKELDDFVSEIKNEGYKIYATKVNGGKSLKTIEKMKKFAIIMGNEGAGVSDSLMKKADQYLYIDMNSSCESLNVAVATSIILYELDK